MLAGARRRFARLRVASRLALLVLIPLLAVIGLAVPVVIERVDQVEAANQISAETRSRQAISVLMDEVQRERLLAIVDLATRTGDTVTLTKQRLRVDAALEAARKSDPRLKDGAERLAALLGVVRRLVLGGEVYGQTVHLLYSQATAAMLDAMPAPIGREASEPPLAPLDELLRANEHATRAGAAAIVAVTEPQGGQLLYADSRTAERVNTGRFSALARNEHLRLLSAAQNSRAAESVVEQAQVIFAETAAPTGPQRNSVVAGLAQAVETYSNLRRQIVDQVAQKILDESGAASDSARTTAILVGGLALLLVLLVAGLAAAGARSIAVPLSRLNDAAVAVAAATGRELERVSDSDSDSDAPPQLRAVPTTGPGEVADLAAAFNQVQNAAAALLERQVTTRRNVSAMFATVARRTRNLADRQLNLIDVLERQQQDPQLLDRLYRLDHVATRLRRSASALLVVSGVADDNPASPMRLADAVRAGAAEIEQFARVQLTDVVDVAAVPGVVPDLILLLAELLDNAVSYSPPPSPVTVAVGLTADGCRLTIVDTGIGMDEAQFAAENRRLVERERLDVAPTQVLGLFVVGRLARRHGLAVTLRPTAPHGVTVHVDIPARLLTTASGPVAPVPQARGVRQAVRQPVGALPTPDHTTRAMQATSVRGQFAWFGEEEVVPAAALPELSPALLDEAEPIALLAPLPPIPAAPQPMAIAPPPPATAAPLTTTGPLNGGVPATGRAAVPGPRRSPESMPADRAPDAPPAVESSPSGLTRRVPGRNLPKGTFAPASERENTVEVDPAAARAEAEAFTTGFARGIATPPGGAMRPPDLSPPPAGAGRPIPPMPQMPGIFERTAAPAPAPNPPATNAPPRQWPLPAGGAPAAPAPPSAGRAAVPPPAAAGGLSRRVPGANLAEELRLPDGPGRGGPAAGRGSAVPPPPSSGPVDRDPEAEARAIDTLVAGFARGEQQDLQQPEFVGRVQAGSEPQDVERR
ncbi:histidine kinase [Virgisporangium aliadipatigenens]|uniref:histidine kinase n=1 Tax=Virgisporangium aliadipatigenens TaxID=741659 RepID=A0A8J4DU18_9ACTN|nr:ATP-binding protein [Virgisporangium aliadipatigenens]GIJ48732.1 histidine kinase [Virgisporangium aliadipatigenens]